jgi:peptide/nickel transport system ATP-binding protein
LEGSSARSWEGDDLDEHVFACFHPVGGEPAAGAVPAAGTVPAAGEPADVSSAGDRSAGSGPSVAGPVPAAVAAPPAYEIPGVLDVLASPAAAAQAVVAHPAGPAAPRFSERLAGREVVVQVDNLEKQYTVTAGAVVQRVIGTVKAVSDVSFSIQRGETFGLVGESGCGKTTTGRLVVALEKPTSGKIRFEGEDIAGLRGRRLRLRRRELQLMFQDPYSSLDPRMRVRSIIREPLVIQHVGSRREQDQRVSDVLAEVGLSPKAGDLYPHEFSGGQRQRIGLARALVLQPKLIVADEPVSALDVSVQAQILNLMRSLQERHDLTYILISHDMAVVKYLADRIGVMYLGKLVEVAPSEELYEHAAHPYTQGLIDTIPVPDPVAARRAKKAPMRGELPSAISPPSGCRFRTRCPFAQEICAEVEPPLRSFGPGHIAACHFPLQQPAGDQPEPLSAASA